MSNLAPERIPSPHPYFDLPLPRVLAHRGLAVGVPDNTLLAFLRALAHGANYLEIDVHATRDGVAVVAHDIDLVRLANRPERISELTFSELKRIRLAENQRVSSLAEVLDAFPDARLNIDIKAAEAVNPTVVAITAARAHHRVLITSFSERRRKAALAQLPGVATSASSSRFTLALVASILHLKPVAARALRGIHAVQVPVRYNGITIVTPRLVKLLHELGIEIHIWTVNDRHTMEQLLDLGIDGLVTDRADIALGLLMEKYPRIR